MRREPYYKVPPPNPREVTPPLPASTHHYEYLDLEGGQGGLQEVTPPTPASGRRSSASSLTKSSLKKKSKAELDSSAVAVTLDEDGDRFYDTKEDAGDVLIKKSKGIATLPDGSTYPCVIVQKKTKKGSLERGASGKDKKFNPTTPLPSKDSCSSKDSLQSGPTLTRRPSTTYSPKEVPKLAKRPFREYSPALVSSKTSDPLKEYSPTPLPSKSHNSKPAMNNDWLDALKPKEVVEQRLPKPKEILDGVLYTSRALQEETQIYEKGFAKFSLIEPEVFQTYDVCQRREKSPELGAERLESDETSGDDVQVNSPSLAVA